MNCSILQKAQRKVWLDGELFEGGKSPGVNRVQADHCFDAVTCDGPQTFCRLLSHHPVGDMKPEIVYRP